MDNAVGYIFPRPFRFDTPVDLTGTLRFGVWGFSPGSVRLVLIQHKNWFLKDYEFCPYE